MKKWLVLGLLTLLVIAIVAYLVHPSPVTVQLVGLDKGDVIATVVNTRAGTIKSCRRAGLSLAVGGVVDEVQVQAGDRVKQGQPLLRLWDKELQAERRRLQETLALARLNREQSCLQADFQQREAERLATLRAKDLVSQSDTDQARTLARTSRLACLAAQAQEQVNAAQIQVLEAQLEERHLAAPFAGVVAEVNSKPGEYMTPSPPGVIMPPVIDLIDDSCLYVSAPIDEVDAARLRVGQPATILLDALPGQRFPATLSRIAPYVQELEKQARTVEIEAHFNTPPRDTPLLIGYSADVEIEVGRRQQVLRLPVEARREDGSVLRYRNGQLELITPETGLENWSWAEVISGLADGDQLVLQPGKLAFQAGMRVTPVATPEAQP